MTAITEMGEVMLLLLLERVHGYQCEIQLNLDELLSE